jgi:hypothetical protein
MCHESTRPTAIASKMKPAAKNSAAMRLSCRA